MRDALTAKRNSQESRFLRGLLCIYIYAQRGRSAAVPRGAEVWLIGRLGQGYGSLALMKTMALGVDGNILMKLASSRYINGGGSRSVNVLRGDGAGFPSRIYGGELKKEREKEKQGVGRRHSATDFHLPISFYKAAFIYQSTRSLPLSLVTTNSMLRDLSSRKMSREFIRARYRREH